MQPRQNENSLWDIICIINRIATARICREITKLTLMSVMASQITSLSIVCSNIYPGAGQKKHQSSASLVFVRGIHRWPVNSPYKGPVTRKIFYLMTSSWTVQKPADNKCGAVIQCLPRIMQIVCALLHFVVVWNWPISSMSSRIIGLTPK